MDQKTFQYNRAKEWQLVCQPMLNLATNLFMLLFNFATYLAVGGYGILVGVASVIITSSRIFDAVTDPIIGFVIDRTNGRFGKFRPIYLLGFTIMTLAVLLMFFVGMNGGVVVFTLLYALYIIGYTFCTACNKASTNVLTNDPKQRPIIGRYIGIYSVLMGVFFSYYVSNMLVPRHGGITVPALQELAITTVVLSAILSVFGLASIWKKDIPEYTSNLKEEKVRFRDMWGILKGNRAIQMLIVAASSDKLALQTAGNSAITMLVWGVLVRNYAFSGKLSLYTAIPSILIIIFGIQFARKCSSKRALVATSVGAIVSSMLVLLVFLLFDPTQIGTGFAATALFLLLWCLRTGFMNVATGLTNPMIADCVDYELQRSGKYLPGMMGTIFSFVDKIISSFATTIAGFMIAAIGYVDIMPQATDPMSTGVAVVGLGVLVGMPIIGWVCTLIAMKFYPLDAKKMEEVQREIAASKAALKNSK